MLPLIIKVGASVDVGPVGKYELSPPKLVAPRRVAIQAGGVDDTIIRRSAGLFSVQLSTGGIDKIDDVSEGVAVLTVVLDRLALETLPPGALPA